MTKSFARADIGADICQSSETTAAIGGSSKGQIKAIDAACRFRTLTIGNQRWQSPLYAGARSSPIHFRTQWRVRPRQAAVPATPIMESRFAKTGSGFRYCDAVGPIVNSLRTSLTPLVCCATCCAVVAASAELTVPLSVTTPATV
jgi:hypothetical protein